MQNEKFLQDKDEHHHQHILGIGKIILAFWNKKNIMETLVLLCSLNLNYNLCVAYLEKNVMAFVL